MTEDEAAKMIAGIGDWDRCIVLFPVGEQTGCRWIGMSKGDCVAMLSKVAAEFVMHHMPPADDSRKN